MKHPVSLLKNQTSQMFKHFELNQGPLILKTKKSKLSSLLNGLTSEKRGRGCNQKTFKMT